MKMGNCSMFPLLRKWLPIYIRICFKYLFCIIITSFFENAIIFSAYTGKAGMHSLPVHMPALAPSRCLFVLNRFIYGRSGTFVF